MKSCYTNSKLEGSSSAYRQVPLNISWYWNRYCHWSVK